MKIGAVVILYNPSNAVVNNINSYKKKVNKLYIFDNTEEISDQQLLIYSNLREVIYLHDGINKGIAKRLNEAITLAIKDELDWLLTMDQDSYFESVEIENYIHCIELYSQKENVSMFGVEYENVI